GGRDAGERHMLRHRRLAARRFVRVAIRTGVPDGLPRPTVTPVEVKTRLMRHIGAAQTEAHVEGAH
ncbi:hypothetical protein QM306_39230, partial [Burkholderia cenocepacia]|nr:hypothetical protein [Burkholderia cenocepacia]